VLGGDMTGKALVPIVAAGGGRYRAVLLDQPHEVEGATALGQLRALVRAHGMYPLVTTADEVAALGADAPRRAEVFASEVRATVERWVALADERLAGTATRCLVCPGNDDPFEIDALLDASQRVERGEGRVVPVGDGYEVVSTGWCNPTPWDTPREESEAALGGRLDAMLATATVPPERLILNAHCPPHSTPLDRALALDRRRFILRAGTAHVGSHAVRAAIERAQPALGLHGHIHESAGSTRLGSTLVLNPGSTYDQARLAGALVDLDGGRRVKRWMFTEG
jgi:Icc-related predicted phosphoesterase